jgi:hypothetical protein
MLNFSERARETNVEAIEDLGRDNAGPLTELYNLDKGCLVIAL